jgi:hypothetical protein
MLRMDQEDNALPIAVFNQTNTKILGNMKRITIPNQILLHYAIFLPNTDSVGSDKSLIAFEVSHELGNTIFRYIRVGDELLEQQISKEPT